MSKSSLKTKVFCLTRMLMPTSPLSNASTGVAFHIGTISGFAQIYLPAHFLQIRPNPITKPYLLIHRTADLHHIPFHPAS
jgi:hypothetical protein